MATAVQEVVGLPYVKESSWTAFIRENGRIPMFGDKKAPWEYRGWLMYYRMEAEKHPDVPARYDYWFRTMVSGYLLEEPIPQIDFNGPYMGDRSAGYKQIDKLAEIANSMHSRSPMSDLLDFLLYGFGINLEDPKLHLETSEKLYRTFNLEPFLLQPYDYLGEWIANHKGSWNPHAFFPTPHSVCELITQMNFTGIPYEHSRGKSVCDPALGSARMLLHASNYSLNLYGCDIDPLMVKVSQFNAALYVPWLVHPFPAEFFENPAPAVGIECRNSIKNPPTQGK